MIMNVFIRINVQCINVDFYILLVRTLEISDCDSLRNNRYVIGIDQKLKFYEFKNQQKFVNFKITKSIEF